MPPSAAPPLVPAVPPSPRCEACHRILRSLTLPYSTAITDSLDSQAAPAPLRIQFAGVTRVPLLPLRRGQQSSHMRLYMMHGISSPRSGIYTGACNRAFYFPLAMSILCCSGWDSGAAGAAWPAAPSAMSGMRVSRAMLILSASSEERASRHWPFTTFFA